jgi:hypothetical protein
MKHLNEANNMNKKDIKREIQYLRIIGRLYPDNTLSLMPSYLTSDPSNSQEDSESSLIAELLDEKDVPLLRHRLSATHYCTDKKVLPELAVRGKIPFPEATRAIKFYRDSILIHEIKVSEGKPQVRITWDVRNSISGKHTISWIGKHSRRQQLQYFIRYTHNDGKNWQRVGWRTNESRKEIDFDQLPGGERCRLAVVATDGVNTTIVETKNFSVPIKACIAMIFSPGDGAEFAPNESILFRGQGFFMEENTPETEALFWTSSIDGEIGKGMLVEVLKLSIGSHRITLTAGTGERAGKATISIKVTD